MLQPDQLMVKLFRTCAYNQCGGGPVARAKVDETAGHYRFSLAKAFRFPPFRLCSNGNSLD
eukprot:1216053-Amphidinium_carterae.1